jgi:hypothetical protein
MLTLPAWPTDSRSLDISVFTVTIVQSYALSIGPQ